jgi:orotate phosphoribosyltransferase
VLVSSGAVAFRTDPPFTFTSGAESPVYVDNRRLLGFVPERALVVTAMVDALRSLSDDDTPVVVAGTATAGIPWASWIADRLSAPMLYVRSGAKEWGHARAIEGAAPAGSTVVLVEDLFFSGGSSLSAVETLRDAGFRVEQVLAIVTYDLPSMADGFRAAGLVPNALTTVSNALHAAGESGALQASEIERVAEWLADRRGETHP